MVSTHLKNISQIGSFPQVGVKITSIWNHHPVLYWMFRYTIQVIPSIYGPMMCYPYNQPTLAQNNPAKHSLHSKLKCLGPKKKHHGNLSNAMSLPAILLNMKGCHTWRIGTELAGITIVLKIPMLEIQPWKGFLMWNTIVWCFRNPKSQAPEMDGAHENKSWDFNYQPTNLNWLGLPDFSHQQLCLKRS